MMYCWMRAVSSTSSTSANEAIPLSFSVPPSTIASNVAWISGVMNLRSGIPPDDSTPMP